MSYIRKAINKSIIEVGKLKKYLYIYTVLWDGPFANFYNLNSIRVEDNGFYCYFYFYFELKIRD